MKKIILAFLVILFYQNASAQQIIAGDSTGTYMNIVPDATLYPHTVQSQSYSVDINQDGTNDVIIKAFFENNPEGYPYRYVYAYAIDSNVVKLNFSRLASACGTQYIVLNPFNIGDAIGSGTYISSGFLELWRYCNGNEIKINDWINSQIDHYIGIKYYFANNTFAYGWIRVRVPPSDYRVVYIKDYALGNLQYVGINEIETENKEIKIYPNPANEILNVELGVMNEATGIKIIDVMCKVIKDERLKMKERKAEIDLSELKSGIYFLQVYKKGN